MAFSSDCSAAYYKNLHPFFILCPPGSLVTCCLHASRGQMGLEMRTLVSPNILGDAVFAHRHSQHMLVGKHVITILHGRVPSLIN